jgi:invasion protein IalB
MSTKRSGIIRGMPHAMSRAARQAATGVLLALLSSSWASAQTPGGAEAGGAVPKSPAPAAKQAAPQATPQAAAKPAAAKVEGSFGSWTLLCGKLSETEGERCSLVLPLVERESQKLVFRVVVAYGHEGNLLLAIDGPTGVALQRGLEFSPDTKKIYRISFQTCLPMGCKAVLEMNDALRSEIAASKQGAITVYALNGKAVRATTSLSGFSDALAALDKRRSGQ